MEFYEERPHPNDHMKMHSLILHWIKLSVIYNSKSLFYWRRPIEQAPVSQTIVCWTRWHILNREQVLVLGMIHLNSFTVLACGHWPEVLLPAPSIYKKKRREKIVLCKRLKKKDFLFFSSIKQKFSEKKGQRKNWTYI